MRHLGLVLMIGLGGAAGACAGSNATDGGVQDTAIDAPVIRIDAGVDTPATEIAIVADVRDIATMDTVIDTGIVDVIDDVTVAADRTPPRDAGRDIVDVSHVDLGPCMDLDGDHYGVGPGCLGSDCDDSNVDIHPGAPEVCNNADDDCNSRIDDGLGTIVCGVGVCLRTVNACRSGVVQRCAPGTGTPEVCNSLDDDCNGLVDDGFGTRSCGVGGCARTIDLCTGGTIHVCTAGTPSPEVCNGTDDDCDGIVDDSIAMQMCGAGACARTAPGCTGGVVPACIPAPPGSETCNGVDDDCDGTTDDGCPIGIAPVGRVLSPVFGSPTGTLADDPCPAGSAVVGYQGRYTTVITAMGAICAPVSLVETRTAVPYTYSVATGAAIVLAQHGALLGTLWSFVCPSGSVVTGIRGNASTSISGLAFSCSRVTVTGMPGTFTVATVPTTMSTFFGLTTGAAFTFSCAGSGIVNETIMHWSTAINGLQAVCATPTLSIR